MMFFSNYEKLYFWFSKLALILLTVISFFAVCSIVFILFSSDYFSISFFKPLILSLLVGCGFSVILSLLACFLACLIFLQGRYFDFFVSFLKVIFGLPEIIICFSSFGIAALFFSSGIAKSIALFFSFAILIVPFASLICLNQFLQIPQQYMKNVVKSNFSPYKIFSFILFYEVRSIFPTLFFYSLFIFINSFTVAKILGFEFINLFAFKAFIQFANFKVAAIIFLSISFFNFLFLFFINNIRPANYGLNIKPLLAFMPRSLFMLFILCFSLLLFSLPFIFSFFSFDLNLFRSLFVSSDFFEALTNSFLIAFLSSFIALFSGLFFMVLTVALKNFFKKLLFIGSFLLVFVSCGVWAISYFFFDLNTSESFFVNLFFLISFHSLFLFPFVFFFLLPFKNSFVSQNYFILKKDFATNYSFIFSSFISFLPNLFFFFLSLILISFSELVFISLISNVRILTIPLMIFQLSSTYQFELAMQINIFIIIFYLLSLFFYRLFYVKN